MRIGIDARFFGGEQSKGIGRYTQKLIEYLARYDHTNEYVIFLQPESFHDWKWEQKNFTLVSAPYRWYTVREQLFMPWKIWKARVDFMHFPHFNVPLLYRKPFVVTIHDLIIHHFPTERATTLGPLLYRLKQFASQLVMRHAVRFARTIITVSEFSKQDIVQYYQIDPAKVVITYEGAERIGDCSLEDARKILKKYGIRKPYFLYVGNAYPHKNLEKILEMMQHWKATEGEIPWNMVFVGKRDYFYKRLEQEAWGKNIDDQTIFTGFVHDVDLPCVYSEATAYLFPSLSEGFGLPPLEAMLYGTPVLAANSSSLPEILGKAALYFNPEDVSDIIRAIKRLSLDQELRTQLVSAGMTHVQRYSWETMMEQTRAIYGENEEKTE